MDKKVMNEVEIVNERLKEIKGVFDLEKVLAADTSLGGIAKYYAINKLAYSLFHNSNFVHMSIWREGYTKQQALLEQAVICDKYLEKLKSKKVLELAAGRGGNSLYLARKHQEIEFYGLDLPGGHTDYAIKKSRMVKNFQVYEGDYHDLSRFEGNSMDLVFVVEALCHSDRKEKVMAEVRRILKQGGIFIVIDAYLGETGILGIEKENLVCGLIAKGMAVPEFESYLCVRDKLLAGGFGIISEEYLSKLILPSTDRFEKLAKRFFKLPMWVKKFIVKLLPREFLYNSISGYLMSPLLRIGIASYWVTVAEKSM